ncbi:putative cytoplasmic thioredoxin [Aspergillus leporis]|uniref:Putative cytoplasmic thioredoxin n=1 Tax=Aspergillus leporis TaxID=41062 RepID=A0A5N5XB64_9EURO|nr:putative cytoplasmic thioredoxin [Aspergillus leporis]
MGVAELKSVQDFKSAISDNFLAIVAADIEDSGPWEAIAPKFELFSNRYPAIKFFRADVDKVPDKGYEYVDKVVGANPGVLDAAVREHANEGKG